MSLFSLRLVNEMNLKEKKGGRGGAKPPTKRKEVE
jgi:hypothetical protein